jgi:putative membrane protein insertion efficiency factor
MFYFIYQLPRRVVVLIIKIYQKTISFDHGFLKIFYPHGFCRFTPTCSQYGVEAVTKHGLLKGGLMTSWRVLRCNPWNKGGFDPVK